MGCANDDPLNESGACTIKAGRKQHTELDGHGGEKCGDTRDRNGHTKPNEQSV